MSNSLSRVARPAAPCLVAAAVAALLAACGDTTTGGPAPGSATATLTAGDDAEAAWHVQRAVAITLADGNGRVVPPAAVTCAAQDATRLVVAADCSSVTALHLGSLVVVASGNGVSANVTLRGVPQRQWSGMHGVAGGDPAGGYGLAVTPDGHVVAWGANAQGVLAQGQSQQQLAFLAVPTVTLDQTGTTPFINALQSSAGTDTAGALRGDGTIWAWGGNAQLQLGSHDSVPEADLPREVSAATGSGGLSHVVQMEFGSLNCVALIDDGTVITWGADGASGVSTPTVPTQALGVDAAGALMRIVQVSAGGGVTLALTADGQVLSWGDDQGQGRLGMGRVRGAPMPTPTPVMRADGTPLTGIVQLSAGDDFSLALAADGTVWAWGVDRHGQAGQGTVGGVRAGAVQVLAAPGVPLARIAMVAAGGDHALALDVDGGVWAWGLATHGQLGDGAGRPVVVDTGVPRAVVDEAGDGAALAGVVSIAAGYEASFALKADGTVLSWGRNASSGLGRPTPGDADDPTPAAMAGIGDGGGTLVLSPAAYQNLLRRGR